MEIIRKSPNFKEYLKVLFNAEPEVLEFERVSLGYRQELGVDDSGMESLLNVEQFGNGAPVYKFDWPEDWGPPPSDVELDAWSAPSLNVRPELTLGDKASLYLDSVNNAMSRLSHFAVLLLENLPSSKALKVLRSDEAEAFRLLGGDAATTAALLKSVERLNIPGLESSLA